MTLIQIVVPLEAGGVVRVKVMVEWTADNVVSIATEKLNSNWRCSAQVQCENCTTGM